MKRLLMLVLVMASVFAVGFGQDFPLDVGQTETLTNGIKITFVSAEVSSIPGEGASGTIEITDGSISTHQLNVGQTAETTNALVTMNSLSRDEMIPGEAGFSGTFVAKEIKHVSVGETLSLNSFAAPKGTAGPVEIELVDVIKSITPGEGGTVEFLLDGSEKELGVGQFTIVGTRVLKVVSASVDEINGIDYAEFVATDIPEYSYGETIALDTVNERFALVGGNLLQLSGVTKSSTPGEGGTVQLIYGGNAMSLGIGQTEIVGTETITPKSASKDEISGVGYAEFIVDKIHSYKYGQTINLDSSKPYAFVNSRMLELIDVTKSYEPGVGGTVDYSYSGTAYESGIGQFLIVGNEYIETVSASVDETAKIDYASLIFREITKVSLGSSFKLDTATKTMAKVDSLLIRMVKTAQSNVPGEGAKAYFEADGTMHSLGIGAETVISGYVVTVTEASLDATNGVSSATFSVEEESPATPAPTATVIPSPTPTPTPTPTPVPTAVPQATIHPNTQANVRNTFVQETTSNILEEEREGTRVRYRIEGNSSLQGYIKIENVTGKPKTVKFDEQLVEECSVESLQTCVMNLLGGDDIDTSGCLCWIYGSQGQYVEVFYPHSEHVIEIEYEEDVAAPAPTATPTTTPAEETTSEPGGNDLLIYGLIFVFLMVIAAGAYMMFIRKKVDLADKLDFSE